MKPPRILLTSIATVLTMGSSATWAANGTWSATPGTGNWIPDNGGTNWNTGINTYPGDTSILTNTDIATFSSTSTSLNVLINSATLNIGGITFGNAAAGLGAYTIGTNAGNSLFLSSGGTIQNTALVPAAGIVNYTIATPLQIEGASGGTYTFLSSGGASSNLVNTFIKVTGGVSGVATGRNTTILTLTGGNNVFVTANVNSSSMSEISGVIGDGAAGGKVAVTLTSPSSSSFTSWLLPGNNTYSGGTTLTRGAAGGTPTLRVASNTALGTGNLTFASGTATNGATLSPNLQNLNLANSITINTGIFARVNTRNNTLTLSGIIGSPDATTTIEKQNSGTLILTGANTYAGITQSVSGKSVGLLIGQSLKHEPTHANVDMGFGVIDSFFIVAGQSS